MVKLIYNLKFPGQMKLEQLLRENYETYHDPECKPAIKEFLDKHGTVKNKKVYFIKRLAKVSTNIIKSEKRSPFFVPHLKKLYKFSLDGVSIIKTRKSGHTREKLKTLEGHLYSHAGTFASIVYKITKDMCWARKYCEVRTKAAEKCEELEPKYAGFLYHMIGTFAKDRYDSSKDIYWAKMWHKSESESERIMKPINPEYAQKSHKSALEAKRVMLTSISNQL